MKAPENNGRAVLAAGGLLMLILSFIYPESMKFNDQMPDLLLVLVILCATLLDMNDAAVPVLIMAIVRDLAEFRYPGPYIFVYAGLFMLIYFSSSFLFRPGLAVSLFFVAAFTFLHDLIWIVLYNVYYLLRTGAAVDFGFGYNLSQGALYHVIMNLAVAVPIYYLLILAKRRLMNEKA